MDSEDFRLNLYALATQQHREQGLLAQLEWLFGEENLPKDEKLLSTLRGNPQGWCSLKTLQGFAKLSGVAEPKILDAIEGGSSVLELSADKRALRRKYPLPGQSNLFRMVRIRNLERLRDSLRDKSDVSEDEDRNYAVGILGAEGLLSVTMKDKPRGREAILEFEHQDLVKALLAAHKKKIGPNWRAGAIIMSMAPKPKTNDEPGGSPKRMSQVRGRIRTIDDVNQVAFIGKEDKRWSLGAIRSVEMKLPDIGDDLHGFLKVGTRVCFDVEDNVAKNMTLLKEKKECVEEVVDDIPNVAVGKLPRNQTHFSKPPPRDGDYNGFGIVEWRGIVRKN